MIRKFKRRPLFVEGVQFNGWNDVEEIRKWAKNGNVFYVPAGAPHEHRRTDEVDWEKNEIVAASAPEFLVVNTPDGEVRAELGWWIVVSEAGDAYVVDPDSFHDVYEEDVKTNALPTFAPTSTGGISYFDTDNGPAKSLPVAAR